MTDEAGTNQQNPSNVRENSDETTSPRGGNVTDTIYSEIVDTSLIEERLQGLRHIEVFLLYADRLFLSQGARLMLFLPQLIALVVGLAVWKEHRSPAWWSGFGETLSGMEFTPFMDWLSVVFLLAMLLMLGISVTQAAVSRRVFNEETALSVMKGTPLNSQTGFSQIESLTLFAIRHRGLAALITLLALLLQLMVILRGSFDDVSEIIRVFSLSFVLTNFGVLMLREDRVFNTTEPWGMLQAYEAEKHNEQLVLPFTEIVLTHADPLMRIKLENLRTGEKSVDNARDFEHLVVWHFLHDDGRMTTAELRERVSGCTAIKDNPISLDIDFWSELVRHLRTRCVPFIRLVDRTLQKTVNDLSTVEERGYHFDIDIDDIFEGNGSIAAQLLNVSSEPKQVRLILESPHLRPQRVEHELTLKPRLDSLRELSKIRFESELDRREAVMRTASDASHWLWIGTSPLSNGELVLNVRLENQDSELIEGRTLISYCRTPMMMRFRRTTGRGALFIALLLPIIRLGWWGISLG